MKYFFKVRNLHKRQATRGYDGSIVVNGVVPQVILTFLLSRITAGNGLFLRVGLVSVGVVLFDFCFLSCSRLPSVDF